LRKTRGIQSHFPGQTQVNSMWYKSVRNRSCTLHDHSFRWWKDSVQWHGLLRPATFYIIIRRLDNRLQGRLDFFFFLRNNINNTERDRCVREGKEGINESIYIYISSTIERDTQQKERSPWFFSLWVLLSTPSLCCSLGHTATTDGQKKVFLRESIYRRATLLRGERKKIERVLV